MTFLLQCNNILFEAITHFKPKVEQTSTRSDDVFVPSFGLESAASAAASTEPMLCRIGESVALPVPSMAGAMLRKTRVQTPPWRPVG